MSADSACIYFTWFFVYKKLLAWPVQPKAGQGGSYHFCRSSAPFLVEALRQSLYVTGHQSCGRLQGWVLKDNTDQQTLDMQFLRFFFKSSDRFYRFHRKNELYTESIGPVELDPPWVFQQRMTWKFEYEDLVNQWHLRFKPFNQYLFINLYNIPWNQKRRSPSKIPNQPESPFIRKDFTRFRWSKILVSHTLGPCESRKKLYPFLQYFFAWKRRGFLVLEASPPCKRVWEYHSWPYVFGQ